MCTAEGALVQLWTLSAGDYAVLAAVEAAMARSSLAAPLSGASHSAFRSAVEASAGGNRALAHSLAGALLQGCSSACNSSPAALLGLRGF